MPNPSLDDAVAEMIEIMKKVAEKNTPAPDGRCHCGGRLMREIAVMSPRHVSYKSPICQSCGRVYLNADLENTAKESIKSFQKRVRL